MPRLWSHQHAPDPEIDRGLDRVLRRARYGQAWPREALAAEVGCHWMTLYLVERRALRKLRSHPVIRELAASGGRT